MTAAKRRICVSCLFQSSVIGAYYLLISNKIIRCKRSECCVRMCTFSFFNYVFAHFCRLWITGLLRYTQVFPFGQELFIRVQRTLQQLLCKNENQCNQCVCDYFNEYMYIYIYIVIIRYMLNKIEINT